MIARAACSRSCAARNRGCARASAGWRLSTDAVWVASRSPASCQPAGASPPASGSTVNGRSGSGRRARPLPSASPPRPACRSTSRSRRSRPWWSTAWRAAFPTSPSSAPADRSHSTAGLRSTCELPSGSPAPPPACCCAAPRRERRAGLDRAAEDGLELGQADVVVDDRFEKVRLRRKELVPRAGDVETAPTSAREARLRLLELALRLLHFRGTRSDPLEVRAQLDHCRPDLQLDPTLSLRELLLDAVVLDLRLRQRRPCRPVADRNREDEPRRPDVALEVERVAERRAGLALAVRRHQVQLRQDRVLRHADVEGALLERFLGRHDLRSTLDCGCETADEIEGHRLEVDTILK